MKNYYIKDMEEIMSILQGLCSFNGKLYAAWKEEKGGQRLFYASYDGNEWSAQKQIPLAQSSVGPALCVNDELLHAVWKGPTGDQGLYYAYYGDNGWSTQYDPPQQFPSIVGSSVGPALTVFPPEPNNNSKRWAAWKGKTPRPKVVFRVL